MADKKETNPREEALNKLYAYAKRYAYNLAEDRDWHGEETDFDKAYDLFVQDIDIAIIEGIEDGLNSWSIEHPSYDEFDANKEHILYGILSGKREMREISTKKTKDGEHILIDGVEYVAEKYDSNCSECAFCNSAVCSAISCTGVIFKKVKKEPVYRPYNDTEEMIADYKERFKVSKMPPFCMPFIWVKDKPAFLTVCTHLIVENFEHVVRLGNSTVHLQNLFDNYTYLDGSPCGKVEE